jgi:hypothetical protein
VHRAIKNSGIKAKTVSEGLVCNGYDPVTFAMVNNAQKTAKFMARKNLWYVKEALIAKPYFLIIYALIYSVLLFT